jgi:hypothetical protein
MRTKHVCEALGAMGKYFGSLIEDWRAGYPLVTGAVPHEVWEELL